MEVKPGRPYEGMLPKDRLGESRAPPSTLDWRKDWPQRREEKNRQVKALKRTKGRNLKQALCAQRKPLHPNLSKTSLLKTEVGTTKARQGRRGARDSRGRRKLFAESLPRARRAKASKPTTSSTASCAAFRRLRLRSVLFL